MYEDIKENLITMFNEHKNKENHEFDNEFLIKHFNVIALNAKTGEEIWRYEHERNPDWSWYFGLCSRHWLCNAKL